MALGLAEFRHQKRLDELPGHLWSDGPATQADDVHVIVLHALARREMVANQAGVNSRNLVGADTGADTASADRDTALHLAGGYCSTEGDDEIGIVVGGRQAVRSEIDDLMSRRPQTTNQIFL